jgi:hypothetical protein
VDTGNPALAIHCPNCGLLTPRFLQYCRNDGYSLWPSAPAASAAFAAWKDADPARRDARPYDLELPDLSGPEVVDFEERAHHLGIHIFPSSNYPFVICLGMFLLSLAAIPFGTAPRVVLGVAGLVIFLIGVVGWVVLEDVRMYPGHDIPVERVPPGSGRSSAGHEHEEERR